MVEAISPKTMEISGETSGETGRVQHILVAGGGTAGWMSAAALAKFVLPHGINVTLVESDSIGTVGVGEATLPHLRFFNESLGLDEREVIRDTHATIKLGIDFRNWGRVGDSYIHPFGDYGFDVKSIPFHHVWSRLHRQGLVDRIDEYSLPVMMAEANRFSPPSDDPEQLMSTFSYAYQLDAGLYAQTLRRYAEERGVVRREGRIESVTQSSDTTIQSITLASGETIEADFFIDCTGFRALLTEKTLGTDFEDWTHWLPCDRAVAIRCEGNAAPEPYTRATAKDFGWMWRIPLQSRIGNGYVYCSDYLSAEAAETALLDQLEGAPTHDPLHLKFRTGWRRKGWTGNCLAVGLSAGFLEPLESTSIYLIQAAITHFIELLPRSQTSPFEASEFNRLMDVEVDRIRDFLILHYHANQRTDTEFWRRMREMEIPDSLQSTLSVFQQTGHVNDYAQGLFLHASWIAVLLGQNILPQGHHPVADALALPSAQKMMETLKAQIGRTVTALPDHRAYLGTIATGMGSLGAAPLSTPVGTTG